MHLCRRFIVYNAVIGGMQLELFFFFLLTNLLPPPSATDNLPFVYIHVNHANTFQSPFSINQLQEAGLCNMCSENFMQNIIFSNYQQK